MGSSTRGSTSGGNRSLESHLGQGEVERGGREGEGSCWEKRNEREGAHGGRAPGARGGWAGVGRTMGQAEPSRTENRNDTNARLYTTSDKINMLRHDATYMST
jgi:hypothetical protein